MADRTTSKVTVLKEQGIVRFLYIFTVFSMALTGFGQMPIYKRYYLADIPGLQWLSNFWTTRYVHYFGAVLLLALLAYVVFAYVMMDRKKEKITLSGYLRGVLLAGIITTGILFVIKNFPIYLFSPAFITVLDLSHLGFVMSFLLVSLYCLVFKKNWTIAREHLKI
jgi:heme A synthase